jgi:hypothetical protein
MSVRRIEEGESQFAPKGRAMMLACRLILGLLLAVVVSWTLASPVGAAPQAFVSASGDDGERDPNTRETTNPKTNCGPVSPCRTIAKALSVVDDGGEVVIVSSGTYGAFLIRKPVSVIAAPGIHAVINAPGLTPDIPPMSLDSAITVSVAGTVVLRGLTLTLDPSAGIPPPANIMGINAAAADILYVEDCVLSGFTSNAITFGSVDFATGKFYLRNTIVTDSGSDFASAVYIGAASLVSIDRAHMESNAHGLVADGGKVIVRDSVAMQHMKHGMWARGLNGPVDMAIDNSMIVGSGFSGFAGILAGNPTGLSRGVRMSVSHSTVNDNGVGILAAQSTPFTTTVWVSNTTIATNDKGIVRSGGAAVLSRQNNTIEGSFRDDGTVSGLFMAK